MFLQDLLSIMPRQKRTEKLIKVWLLESVFTPWKSKKDLAGYSNNTNSEFAELLLHRESSASTPDGISKKRRLEEISSDGLSKLASTCLVFLQLLIQYSNKMIFLSQIADLYSILVDSIENPKSTCYSISQRGAIFLFDCEKVNTQAISFVSVYVFCFFLGEGPVGVGTCFSGFLLLLATGKALTLT